MARVRILGAGAIGLAVASQMTASDITPQFLCDAQRKERYKSKVFFVNNEPLTIDPITPEEVNEAADLIIVSVKHAQLEKALDQLEGSVGPETVIVSLMNGIDSEATIGKRYGIEKVVHAFIVEIDAVKEGDVLYFTNPGQVVMGDVSGKETPVVKRAQEIMTKAHVKFKVTDTIEKQMWWKFMINVGVNQTSAVLGAPYRVFQTNKYAQDIMNDAMQEVILISQKMGIGLDSSDLKRWYDVLNKLGPDKKTSMLQDVEAGRKTEVEMFAGTVCALGEAQGVPTPANVMLYNMIKAYEAMHGIV